MKASHQRIGRIAGVALLVVGFMLIIWASTGHTLLLPMTRYRIGITTILVFGSIVFLLGVVGSARPHPVCMFLLILVLPVLCAFAIAYRPPDRGQEEFVFFPRNGRDKWVAMRVWSSPYDWLDQYMSPHPEFGVGCQPHVIARHHTRDFDVTYRINADGFRVMPAAAPNAPVVAFCGCSFTFGVGVNDDQVYTSLLAEKAWPRIQVINMSVSGWGTNACCLAVEKAIQRNPKPVLIVYPMIDHHLVRVGSRRSWHQKVNASLFPKFSDQGKYEGLVDPNKMPLMEDGPPVDQQEADVMRAILQRMVDSCAKASIPFVAIVLSDSGTRNLRAILDQVPGLHCLWLDDVCDPIYPHDSHPTPEGHLNLARAISRSTMLAQVAKMDELYHPGAFPDRFPHEGDYYLGVERPNSPSNANIHDNAGSSRFEVTDIVADTGKLRDTLLYRSFPPNEAGIRNHLTFEAEGEGVLEVRLMERNKNKTAWEGSTFSLTPKLSRYDFYFSPSYQPKSTRLALSIGGASRLILSEPLLTQIPIDATLDLNFQLADPTRFHTLGQARLLDAHTRHWRIEGIRSPEKVNWHVGMYKQPVSLRKGTKYRLSMRIRADQPRPIYLGIQQSTPPYESRGISQSIMVPAAWKELIYEWTPARDTEDNKISLLMGSSEVPVEIEAATFHSP